MPRVAYASPVGLGGIQKQKTWNKLETERDCILRMVRLDPLIFPRNQNFLVKHLRYLFAAPVIEMSGLYSMSHMGPEFIRSIRKPASNLALHLGNFSNQ